MPYVPWLNTASAVAGSAWPITPDLDLQVHDPPPKTAGHYERVAIYD
jgi:hypothetical protein